MGYQTFQIALTIQLLTSSQLAMAATLGPATGTEIHDIRIGSSADRTRIVFDLSGPTAHKLTLLESPARVLVDLPHIKSNCEQMEIPLPGTPITGIHCEVQADSSLRYVFNTTQAASASLFALNPYQTRGHRLVLDLSEPAARSTGLTQELAASSAITSSARIPNEESRSATTGQGASIKPEPVRKSGSGEWSGYISLDTRLFFQSPAFRGQDSQNASIAFEPEYYYDWDNGEQRFAFRPFFRYDVNDDERTHADIRELYWRVEHGQWLFKAGLDVVFWGVAESRHLVDIINQTDLVENIDGEDKLGQPMLNLDYMSDWGTWQLYVLPYFRERTFPGEDGRLRTEPEVDTDNEEYESGDEEEHVDYAVRWSHYIGDWDVGLAHFSGTSRDPLLSLSTSGNKPSLIPLYLQIDQTSLDIQATKGAWLWKLEALYNNNKLDNYYAYVAGFEYTHFGVANTATDLGLLLEYNYDERGVRSLTALENDIYFGVRLTGNDTSDSRFLAGVVVDTDTQSTFLSVEAARRIGESWTLSAESRLFSNIDRQDPLYFIKDDDYIEIQLSRFF